MLNSQFPILAQIEGVTKDTKDGVLIQKQQAKIPAEVSNIIYLHNRMQ
jgi:hypothetical protein